MAERWNIQSEKILREIEKLSSIKERDRLEIINTMIFTLNALDRSARGWRNWIQNLNFMSRFSEEELIEIEKGLIRSVNIFMQYDIEVTKKYENKLPQVRVTIRKKRKQEGGRGIYA